MQLNTKRVLITGAGSGIGRELAIQLAGKGAKLILWDVDETGLAETEELCPSVEIETKRVDVSDRKAVHEAAADLATRGKAIDLLINNAGVGLNYVPTTELSYDDLEWLININLWGVIHCSKAFLPQLLDRPEATLVNISSIFAFLPVGQKAAYSLSKMAVRGFSESLRAELRHSSLRVLTVFPGGIRTNIARHARYPGAADKAADLIRGHDRMAGTSAEAAAQKIIRAVERNKARLLIGKDAHIVALMERLLPVRGLHLFNYLLRKSHGRSTD